MANLAFTYRPKKLDEIVGQDFVKSVIRGVIRHPEQSPKSLVFFGSWGLGKSTIARCFAKELNNVPDSSDILESQFYYEFDSAVVGNVDTVRDFRDLFSYTYSEGYRVIVFDECHSITASAQAALLKILEEENLHTFYIFVTTEAEKLLKTIRSRSVELQFDLVSRGEIVSHLRRVCEKEGKQVSENSLTTIADRSMGHVRDSLMFLDKLFLVGEEEFLKNVYSLSTSFEKLFSKSIESGASGIRDNLISIVQTPLIYVRQDLEAFILKNMFAHQSGTGVFKSVPFTVLIQFFAYYVNNKSASFASTSDAFSFLFLLCRMIEGKPKVVATQAT